MVLRKGIALLAMLATAKGQMTLSSEKYGNNGCPGQMSANGNVCEQSVPLSAKIASDDALYGGSGIQYLTSAQVVLRSQIDESPPGSIADIQNEADISADEGNRYIKMSVSMNEASSPGACDITIGGDLSDKVTKVESEAIDGTACSFYLANNKYLGNLDVTVRFDGDDNKRVKLFLQYAPHANDPSIKDARALGFTSSDLTVVEQNENLHSLVWNDGASSASGNDLVLPVNGLFIDKRYKVKGDAGIQLLDAKLRDGGSDATFSLLTEGLTLKTEILDYIGNGGTSVAPTAASQLVTLSKEDAYGSYSGTASNTGVDLSSEGDVQSQGAGGAIAADYAQYKLDASTELAIEGLPTFRKEYLDTACEVCDIRITLKGLDNGAGGFLVNTAIDIDDSKLAEDNSNFQTNQLKLVAIAASKDVASGSAHALSEIFSIAESSVTKTSSSLLTDTVDLIGLITLDGAAESCNAGDDLSAIPLYKFKSALLQPYLVGCEITAPDTGTFGASQDIVYNNQADAAATVALRETDGRVVTINGIPLVLNGETDLTEDSNGNAVGNPVIAPVGDTLKLIIAKSGITGAANFDVVEIKRGNVEKVDTTAVTGTPATFATNPTDNTGKDLLIKSTTRCTGSLQLKLSYTGATGFYDLKLPCSRISASSADDSINFYYLYETALNLATDTLEVSSYYSENDSFQSASTSFGKCDNNNDIDRSEIYDSDACPASGDFTDVPADSKLSYSTVGDGLETLIKCSTKNGQDKGVTTISSNGAENYVIDYELAMKYTRQLTDQHTAFDTTTSFCDSQKFVMTVRRDAEAFVESVQLEPSDILRAVLISDIAWSDEGAAGCDAGQRRLRVLVQSKDKHNNGWSDSQLTAVMLDIAAGHQNPNSMSVHTDSGHTTMAAGDLAANALDSTPTQGVGTHVILKGQCIAIASCPVDADGIAVADAGVNGDSWSDYSGSFRTDIILRGQQIGVPNNAISFDTRALITLSYQECPVDGGFEASGEAALALQLTVDQCTDFTKSSAQYTAEEVQDCTDAGEDDSAVVKGYTFVVPDGTAANAYTFAMYTEAQSQGWSIESSVIKFSRHNSEDVFQERYDACVCDEGEVACTVTDVNLDSTHGAFTPSCSTDHELTFPLTKFKFHPTDLFYVEYTVVLKSSLTERRHLRSTKFALKSSAEAYGESNGFKVHSTVAESNAEAPAPDAPESSEARAAPAAPVSEAAETSGPNKQSIDESWWFGLIALVLVCLGILLRLCYCAFPALANQGNNGGSGVLSAQPGAYGYKAVRQSRYSNLRY